MAELDLAEVNQLVKDQKYQQIVNLYQRKEPHNIKRFHKIKLNGKIYTLNQDVAICALNNDIYSGKLIRIFNIKDPFGTYIPIVHVQWYYTKQDLKVDDNYLPCISEKELFFSTHTEYLAANKIQCPIQVLTFEQYSKLEQEEETTFFTRAAIDLRTMEPLPSIKLWQKNCICKMPQNPDLPMINCDTCHEWFHIVCVGLTQSEADLIETYKCPGC